MCTQPPDVYSDQFTFTVSPYGITITFSLTSAVPVAVGRQPDAVPQAIVRMSPEMAKVLTMTARRYLKQYELEHLGDSLKLPAEIWRQLGMDEGSSW